MPKLIIKTSEAVNPQSKLSLTNIGYTQAKIIIPKTKINATFLKNFVVAAIISLILLLSLLYRGSYNAAFVAIPIPDFKSAIHPMNCVTDAIIPL